MPVLVCVIVILLDQWVKYYIASSLPLGTSIPVLPGIFHITYIQNPGAAFGILENQQTFFILNGVAILIAAAWFYPRLKQETAWVRYGSAMLLGGAVGNLIDRVWLGKVIDFFDFRIWPIFNIADIAIVCGVGCIMYAIVFRMKETES